MFFIFIATSLSLLFLISLKLKTKNQYSDQVVLAWLRICFDIMVGSVNLIILLKLHRKLRNFNNDKLQEQMLKVKFQFALFNLCFVFLVIIDVLRLLVSTYQSSRFIEICLESVYHIIVFFPVIYVCIMHLKIN